jgi:predicted MFS family arabinose efflux permease
MAYGAWTASLTFVGAFFIERLRVPVGATGWLLATGAAAHFVGATHSGPFLRPIPRRRIVAGSALTMAILMFVLLGLTSAAPPAVATFCVLGLVAGIRSPASSGLGLEQLPGHPAAMMAARTAATQLGYLLGAVVGGAVLSHSSYGALGVVLALGMAGSALLILRVDEGRAAPRKVLGSPPS